jgi:hypothetical protein
MTYIDYIKNFWLQHNAYSLTVTETALYFYLLETNNLCRWANTFNRNNSKVLADLNIASLKTLSAARNRLKQVGLIDFKTKNGSANVSYTLVKFTEVREQVASEVREQVREQVASELNKTKTKTKTKCDNSGELFPPEKGNSKKPKPKKPEPVYPTLEEVIAYFEGKLPDWEEQARKFFYFFDSLGWRNANGAKIERWDSKANLWIMDEQAKQYQHGKQSENSCGGNKPSDNGTTAGKLKAVEL